MEFDSKHQKIVNNIKNEVKEYFKSPVNRGVTLALPIYEILCLAGYGIDSCSNKDQTSSSVAERVIYTTQDSSK